VEDSKPWYRQFWPWFLIALPGSVVIAGLTTVYIAFNGADTLVNDNYYREGLAINQRLEQDQQASAMNLSAVVKADPESGELFVSLAGSVVVEGKLILQLLHPTDEKRDKKFLLSTISPGHYRADLDTKLNHRYYLRLFPESNPVWRLNGEINFSHDNQVTLMAE
jgi:hypothetical protein